MLFCFVLDSRVLVPRAVSCCGSWVQSPVIWSLRDSRGVVAYICNLAVCMPQMRYVCCCGGGTSESEYKGSHMALFIHRESWESTPSRWLTRDMGS